MYHPVKIAKYGIYMRKDLTEFNKFVVGDIPGDILLKS